jgi:hypothetical protein
MLVYRMSQFRVKEKMPTIPNPWVPSFDFEYRGGVGWVCFVIPANGFEAGRLRVGHMFSFCPQRNMGTGSDLVIRRCARRRNLSSIHRDRAKGLDVGRGVNGGVRPTAGGRGPISANLRRHD